VLPGPVRQLLLRDCCAEACRCPSAKHDEGRSETAEQNQVNHYAVENIIPSFFQNTLGSKRTRDEKGTGLLGDETWNDRKKENEQPDNVEGH
jgi:hypothetical protein